MLQKWGDIMKRMSLALVLPLLLTGCAAYVGDYGPGYPGYYDGYDYGGPGYVGIYSYNRGYYHHDYHHYDTGSRGSAVAYRGSSHVGSSHAVASVSRSGGHSGGCRSASVSSGRR